MEEELITKKELLDHYGISYGALYRWKRKCLIPDEWFIHKATFTGQETFFPKEKIIKRVDLIMSLKDTMSLDEIAESLIPSFTKASLDTADILALGISDEETLNKYLGESGNSPPLDYTSLLEVSVITAYGVNVRAAECAARAAASESRSLELIVLESDGATISFCADGSLADSLIFESNCVVRRNHVADIISSLKNKLSKISDL